MCTGVGKICHLPYVSLCYVWVLSEASSLWGKITTGLTFGLQNKTVARRELEGIGKLHGEISLCTVPAADRAAAAAPHYRAAIQSCQVWPLRAHDNKFGLFLIGWPWNLLRIYQVVALFLVYRSLYSKIQIFPS